MTLFSWMRTVIAPVSSPDPVRPEPVDVLVFDDSTHFIALDNFYSPDTRSEYVAGLSYRVRPEDMTLGGLLPQWVAEKKVSLEPSHIKQASVLRGKGVV
jgi:hypothetical protein